MVMAWPATVSTPLRAAASVFAATVKPTLAAPLPLEVLSVIQGTALAALQLQPAPAETVTVPPPPAAAKLVAEDAAAIVQTVAPAAWLMTTG